MTQPMHVCITGATGTLGKAVIAKLLEDESVYITGISRDEQKQRLMPKHPRLRMCLGDIRDVNSLTDAMRLNESQYDVIFHFAALKCVDTLEANPLEAYRTNVEGTRNVTKIGVAIGAKVVMASTDKAVYPVNAYGMSKGMAERGVLAASRENLVCRYGNVLGSRGSLLEGLKNSLLNSKKAYITDDRMTRFWLTLDDAANFVLECALEDMTGLQLPFFAKSCSVTDLIHMTAQILDVRDYHIEKIGVRPGEKLHECLANEFETKDQRDILSNDPEKLMNPYDIRNILVRALGQ